MKKSDFTQLKSMELSKLAQRAIITKKELAGLLMDRNSKKQKNVKVFRNTRKDLAQILTVLKQRQLLEELVKKEEK